ncbi:hypothetical protein F4779DRAFT_201542 [Xylariaceae sp. FL0662B]|nr:hypothetical protein F4779DRAFT_201542 [Xylariaceae sp. FL0662B]
MVFFPTLITAAVALLVGSSTSMLYKIALEEAWANPESLDAFNPGVLAPAGVIGDDLIGNLLDVHGQRLRQMDQNGVELMVLSLTSPGAQGIANKTQAEELARVSNDRMEAEVLRNPRRFAGLAALSMHDPVQAGKELRRCITEKEGFLGALVNDFQTAGEDNNTMLFFDQPKYDAFWSVANELEVPIYIHPRVSSPLISKHMWEGRKWLDFSALGYADRVNMHLLGIITNGVLDRFPKLKLVVGHMGEHIPFDLYRIDHKLNRDRFPDMPMRHDRLVRDYFGSQIFFTTSGHFSTSSLLFCLGEVGSDSAMFSIDYPYESIPNGAVWFDEHVQPILNKHDMVRIGRGNALKVFSKLTGKTHGLVERTPEECEVGGLLGGEAEPGLYNKNWTEREIRVVPENQSCEFTF